MCQEVSRTRSATVPSPALNSTSNRGFWNSLSARVRAEQPVRLTDDESRPIFQDLKRGAPIWRAATRQERKREKLFTTWLTDSGIPPWTPMSAYDGIYGAPQAVERLAPLPLAPQMSVREWADDYCQSTKILKDFKFSKVAPNYRYLTRGMRMFTRSACR